MSVATQVLTRKHKLKSYLAMPEEQEIGLLKILPKKGDKSDPGNYRGIMLLEVAYKIGQRLANILHLRASIAGCPRVARAPEHVDHESQCGFRRGRGTCDAFFTLASRSSSSSRNGASMGKPVVAPPSC